MSGDRQARMNSVAQRYVDAERYAGIEWQVDVAGEVFAAGRCGHADAQGSVQIPEGAIYRIYSMTKPIVSLLALQLIEQGKLRLYDMLAAFDQRFASASVLLADGGVQPLLRPVTVEDLLTHRSGMTYEFIPGCHVAQYYREADIIGDGSRSLDGMMDALAQMPLAFQPGSAWRYGVSIDALAHVCVLAGDDSLDNLLRDNIFTPLGMIDTAFEVPAAKRDRLLPMYGVGDLTAPPALTLTPQTLEPMSVDEFYPADRPATFHRGGHGLFSTLADYVKFAAMLIDGKAPDGKPLVSRIMHQMLQANRIPASQLPLSIGPNAFPGYGWGLVGRVMMDHGQAVGLTGVGEFGWAGAASTYFWVDPAERMSGVIMTQYLGATLPLADDMRTAAYQAID